MEFVFTNVTLGLLAQLGPTHTLKQPRDVLAMKNVSETAHISAVFRKPNPVFP
jgi:hypothetical protein